MESIYLIIVGVLFVLAISDLVVGVSNDAVNFLNSAIGSRSSSFKVIMLVAALGVVVGATFSSGMMEVARKGIFHPQMFYFSEIMIIFFAVMITDVILLDTFNTLGLPTSTTVSIVFELLGAAVAISLLKVMNDSNLNVSDYINSSKALLIISGILLSVVVAFISGAIIQYISRLIFSFRFKRKMKLYGAIWGGISITAITYFILIKGLKGSSYADYDMGNGVILKEWVKQYGLYIIGLSFVAWTFLLQLSTWLFKVNIPKIIVLVGTFALAMAFAGNDLVNFIGVPLAGYQSYLQFISDPSADPNAFLMSGLNKKVETPFVFLLIAGLIMVATLYFNKKARRVIKTSLDLSRQSDGAERFGSTIFSKTLVRSAIIVNKKVSAFVPHRVSDYIRKQFDDTVETEYVGDEKPAFDMIRASTNLVVASVLISFATSLKLPLSTTYVTFMVAMGTSLADNAWGRESAVYRITGVISVIMGWFFTAMAAFTVAFIVAYLSQLGGFIVVGLFILLAAYAVYRSNFKVKSEEELEAEKMEASHQNKEALATADIYRECNIGACDSFHLVSDVYSGMVNGLANEKRKELKRTFKKAKAYNKKVKLDKDNIKNVIERLNEESFNTAQYYTLVLDYMREIGHNMMLIAEPAFEHVDNNHKPIGEFQTKHLGEIANDIAEFTSMSIEIITENNYRKMDELLNIEKTLLANMDDYMMAQIKRLKKNKSGAKNTKLFLNILAETKSLTFNMINLIKSQRDLSKLAGQYRD